MWGADGAFGDFDAWMAEANMTDSTMWNSTDSAMWNTTDTDMWGADGSFGDIDAWMAEANMTDSTMWDTTKTGEPFSQCYGGKTESVCGDSCVQVECYHYDGTYECLKTEFVGLKMQQEDCSSNFQTCEEQCSVSDCKNGLYCTITECVNSCGESTCQKEWYTDDFEMKTKDCKADRSDDCVDVCEWEQECPDDDDSLSVCWKETCDNGCGQGNCTHWFKETENSDW